MIRGKRIELVCLCIGVMGFVSSASGMDLMQAYRAALENDATFQSVKASAEATREMLPQARAQLLPQLSANVSKYKNDTFRRDYSNKGDLLARNSYPNYDSSNGTLALRQPLFRLGSIAAYAQALSMVEGADATEEKGRQDLIIKVTSTYLDVLMAQDTESQLKAQKDSYEAQLNASKRAFKAGQGTRTDIEEAQARYDATAAQLIAAQSQIDNSLEQLQALVDQPVKSIARLRADRLMLIPPDPQGLADWISSGEENSPELKRLRADVESAEKEVLKNQAGHFPTVDAVVQRNRTESDTFSTINTVYLNTQVGVQVSIPIFSSGYVSATVAEARQRLAKARHDYEAARRNLRVQLRQQYQGVTDGIEQIRAFEQALRSAEQAIVGTRKGVEAGTRTSLDVLNAEEKRSTALRDLGQARYRYLMARVALCAYAGADSTAEMERINQWLIAQ